MATRAWSRRTAPQLARPPLGPLRAAALRTQFCDFLNDVVPGHLCEVGSAHAATQRSALVREFMGKARVLFQRMCSMAGVWGSRTQGGQLFSMRNLDWLAQSGAGRPLPPLASPLALRRRPPPADCQASPSTSW